MKKIYILGILGLCQIALAQNMDITNAYARATVGQSQSGAFLTITNHGTNDDTLISATVDSSIAGKTELHTHIHENGVIKMREVKQGINIQAGKTTELKPGSYHIMFFDLKQDLREGESFPLTLKFKSGAESTVNVNVKNINPSVHHHSTHHH